MILNLIFHREGNPAPRQVTPDIPPEPQYHSLPPPRRSGMTASNPNLQHQLQEEAKKQEKIQQDGRMNRAAISGGIRGYAQQMKEVCFFKIKKIKKMKSKIILISTFLCF